VVRDYEFRGDGSAKFWQIGRDGSEVTVRVGRIGTAGQTQVKDLGNDAAAEAHVEKLVAAKLKNGYVLVGPATALPALRSQAW
jgi:predicted DNA-binding WGR domain protein